MMLGYTKYIQHMFVKSIQSVHIFIYKYI